MPSRASQRGTGEHTETKIWGQGRKDMWDLEKHSKYNGFDLLFTNCY